MIKASRGSILPITLLGSVIIGFIALAGLILNPNLTNRGTSMFINPNMLNLTQGQQFSIDVIVKSDAPVNAFTGILEFDEQKLRVDKIDYNTSIADLWAEEPWFNKGEGKIIFTGGSTKSGGFTGEGSLVTVTFVALTSGATNLKLVNTRILKHDGLGTDAELSTPIDAIFTITPNTPTDIKNDTVLSKATVSAQNSTDLNTDGQTSLADVSIFMIHLALQNLRSDFNNDGSVNTTDLSILLNNRN